MSMFEWPEPMLKAVIAEGLASHWKDALILPTTEARAKAKQEIIKQMEEMFSDDSDFQTIIHLYIEVGPLLAENKAISKAAAKMPQIRNVAPEVLDEQEAVNLMERETLLPKDKWEGTLKLMLRYAGPQMRSLENNLRPAYVERKPQSSKGLPPSAVI